MSRLSVLIVGAGAIGGLYGAMLAKAGCRVDVWCRHHPEEIRQYGYAVQSPWGTFAFKPHDVLTQLAHSKSSYDWVIVATKALPEINVAELIRPVVGANTAILILQNGIGVETTVHAAFPMHLVAGGLAFVCVTRQGRRHIHHQDFGRVVIGKWGGGDDLRISRLLSAWQSVGVPAILSHALQLDRWRKLVWNVPFNPLSAILNQTTDQLLAVPEIQQLCRAIMAEVVSVAAADGYPLPADVIDRNMSDTQRMAPYRTSMLVDLDHGRPIERVAIVENVIRIAAHHQVPVPTIQIINTLLCGIETHRLRKGDLQP